MAMDVLCAIDAARSATERRADELRSGLLRRCIVTREILPKAALIRFAIAPSGEVVPDARGELPGRGLWVKAERVALESAVAKNQFGKVARRPVEVPPDLASRTVALLRQHCLDLIGLACRAGQVTCGFENVRRALRAKGVGVLLAAADAATQGRDRLRVMAGDLPIVGLFTVAELSAALGRDNVVHAALRPGRLAERLAAGSARLAGIVTDEVR
jgi:hypothetical protein